MVDSRLCARSEIDGQAPFSGLHGRHVGRADDAFIPGGSSRQALTPLAPVRGILSPDPIRVCVSRWYFSERPEKAFSSTLKVSFIEIGGGCHADSRLDFAIVSWGFRFGSLEQRSGSV